MLNAALLGIVSLQALLIYGLFCWIEENDSRLDPMARLLISVIVMLMMLAVDVGGIAYMVTNG
jgi:uncharacterized membrane protein